MKENLTIKKEYLDLSKELFKKIIAGWQKEKLVIGICGESGSGKSITGFCLKNVFENNDYGVAYIQMDDYFHLPPATNHQNRLKSFDNIGPHEVNLEMLGSHLKTFVENENTVGQEVDFNSNKFNSKALELKGKDVLIVEGTYIAQLQGLDVLIFIDRTYKQTLHNRISRGREAFDPFIETVLEIEHKIIKEYKILSQITIDNNYKIENSYA